MSAYQLFSDATLDLPHTTIEELDIQVIPMHFDLAENSYRHFEDERELSLEALAAWVMEYRTRVAHWFTVDDLNHLKRGGRISAVEAIVGTALNIKPILSVDGEGKLTVMAKVRGSRKALEYVLSRLSAEGKDLEGQTAIVAHADNPADAETLADLVRQTGLVKDVLISKIGPIIGTHTGAGMTALVFLK